MVQRIGADLPKRRLTASDRSNFINRREICRPNYHVALLPRERKSSSASPTDLDGRHAEAHVDTCLACCDDFSEFSVQLLPTTLGRPKMNKAMYSESFRAGVAQLKPVTVQFDEVIDAGTVFTLRAASNGQSVSGTPWAFEYIFIVGLTEPKDGGAPKIVSMMEFVDSAEVQKFFVAEQAAKDAASK
ncbi:hypothetical protein B0H19DRAFT_1185675 [Mycena capillaripes]|nr:hypothetical protein B0H19DRAFT_1185675 [Mycena capillaripes]